MSVDTERLDHQSASGGLFAALPQLGYVRRIFVDPFVVSADNVLMLSAEALEQRRRAALLRLILYSVGLAILLVAIPVSALGGTTPLYLFTLVAELALATLCLAFTRFVGATRTGVFFVFGTLVIGLDFTLRNPAGVDVQVLLLYSILSLVAFIAGLALPVWVIWLAGGTLIVATIPGVLFTPLSPQLRSLADDPTAIRLGALSLLIANQALVTVFSWVSARSAGAGVQAAVRAVERERELAALKDQFLLDANHELRTPIMAWYNNLELLSRLDERLSAAKRGEILARALNSGATVRRILATMLDPSVVGITTPRVTLAPVALGPLVRSVVETFDPLLVGEPGLESIPRLPRTLTVNVQGDLIALADADRARQVLINLLTNALKYSPPETPIAISVVAVAHSASHGRLRRTRKPSDEPSREQARVCVRDYGAGIPPNDVPKLFQRFVRLERDIAGSVRGTGIGLYLSRVLVEAMGGRIWVESTGVPGEGSCFYFTLPMAVGSPSQDAPALEPVASASPHHA